MLAINDGLSLFFFHTATLSPQGGVPRRFGFASPRMVGHDRGALAALCIRMCRTTPSILPMAIILAAAHSIGAASRVSANGPPLLGRSLSLDVSESLVLGLDVDPGVEGGGGNIAWVAPDAPPTPKDRRRAHRGSIMAALGVPLLISGVGALVWTAAASPTNGCGQPRSRKSYAFAGLGMTTLGVGFSSAGFVALRRASSTARQSKSRRTRMLTRLSAALATFLGLGTLTGVGIYGAFCST